MVFVPNDMAYHYQSNYYVHTAFWIRGRYIQRALVINSCLRNHTDTIHKQWDIRGDPLFNEVCDKVRQLSRFEGINTPMINTDGDDGGVTEKIVLKKRHKGPTSCQRGYTAVNGLTKALVTKAQNSQEIFDLIMPILRELYKKSVILTGKSFGMKTH